MKDQQLVVNMDKDSKVQVLHVLSGPAPLHLNPKQTVISGDIHAVAQFIKTRQKDIDLTKSHIVFNETDKTIVLLTDDRVAELGYQVTATLEEYPELNAFGINTRQRYSLRDLESHIKMNRFWFKDKADHLTLLASLKNFNAKILSEIKDEADQRGNKNKSLVKEVKTDMAADFVLSIPLFKGSAASTFRVEICYDATDSGVQFWLESVELFEQQKAKLVDVLGSFKKDFEEKGFTVINA